ncbi:MAG TPA: epoxyqueuosine reductase [Lachnospiraceae bacterium]|nr:epoxyqueuosine reductase [Lachnospiraceae bacterium]
MKEDIRKIVLDLGADVCGFASVERFDHAPEGYHPRDSYSDCKTVVVIGLALPKGLYEVKPDLIYGHFNNLTCHEVDRVSMMVAKVIEEAYDGVAVPLPCDGPYEYWDSDKMEGHGLMSMKHAAVNAGIGTMGKNTLLINPKYGNRLTVGAILTNLELSSDEYAEPSCINGCNICVKSCPVQAISAELVNQKLCRSNTYGKTERGFDTVECNHCRSVCPMRFGK